MWSGSASRSTPTVLDAATVAIEAADLVLVVGTSSVVYPVAALPHLARRRDARIVEINIDETPLTGRRACGPAWRGRRRVARPDRGAVKALAPQDRPREKLLRSGVDSLGDNELVALLLGTGVRSRSALTVAQDVLERAGGVRGLARVGADDLRRVSGVGGSRAARLLAAVELGRRVIRSDVGERPRLGSARSSPSI